MSDTKETTQVTEVLFDNLDDLGLGPSAENIMVPAGEEKKSVLSSPHADTSFLDKPDPADTATKDEEKEEEPEKENPNEEDLDKGVPQETTSIDQIAKEVEEDEDKNPGGRPKLTKDVMVETASKLIEKGLMFPFDDGKKIEDYSQADWEELLEANFAEKERQLQEALPQQFMATLPPQLQKAYAYVQQGGQDMVGMFRALGAAEEIAQLDTSSEQGQEEIVRAYYHATAFGTPEEIEEEIDSLRDRDELHTRAERYKPRLDQMEEQTVQARIAAQAEARRKQEDQSRIYQDSVYEVLKPGKLNGLDLDGRTQDMLFAGLIQPNYPSINGKSTTMLGHLLEKYQWIEPNHGLIAETLWLLADPEGYKERIRSSAQMENTAEVVRGLKTAERNKSGMSSAEENDGEAKRPEPRKGVPRKRRSFFDRND